MLLFVPQIFNVWNLFINFPYSPVEQVYFFFFFNPIHTAFQSPDSFVAQNALTQGSLSIIVSPGMRHLSTPGPSSCISPDFGAGVPSLLRPALSSTGVAS